MAAKMSGEALCHQDGKATAMKFHGNARNKHVVVRQKGIQAWGRES
jgi:hypothetical protein